MVIFHSYVNIPEGNPSKLWIVQNPAPVGRWFIQVYPIIIQLFTVVHGYQLQIQLVPYARARLQDDGMPLVLGPHTSASSVSLI
jgi:hypothetical protein